MHVVLSNAEAMRYWSTLPHTTLAETREWLAKMMASDPAGSEDFIVEHRGRAIGKVGCYRLPEIGYILHPDHWGLGLATEALTAVIEHVFKEHPVAAITADVDPRNAASIRLLERLGFTRSGQAHATWCIGGVWHDSVYYKLPRPPHMTE